MHVCSMFPYKIINTSEDYLYYEYDRNALCNWTDDRTWRNAKNAFQFEFGHYYID